MLAFLSSLCCCCCCCWSFLQSFLHFHHSPSYSRSFTSITVIHPPIRCTWSGEVFHFTRHPCSVTSLLYSVHLVSSCCGTVSKCHVFCFACCLCAVAFIVVRMSSSRLSARGRAQGSAARMSKPDRDALNGADAAAEASAAFSAQQPPHIDTNLFHDRVLPGLQESDNTRPANRT